MDGLTYSQIEAQSPEEFAARQVDKLRYRCALLCTISAPQSVVQLEWVSSHRGCTCVQWPAAAGGAAAAAAVVAATAAAAAAVSGDGGGGGGG